MEYELHVNIYHTTGTRTQDNVLLVYRNLIW